ncbi:glycosyltransferase [bacterium]|nr:glycosyltransferase [bacterium]
MKHFLFIGGFFPEKIAGEIHRNSKGPMQYAADTLQKGLLKGLLHDFPNLFIINFPFVGSFPSRYKKVFIPSCETNDKGKGRSLSYLNVTLLKQFIIYFKAKKEILSFMKSNQGDVIIIVYSIQWYFLKAAVDVCRKFENLKICLIVPDLPQDMAIPKGFSYKIFRKIQIQGTIKLIKKVHSFVLLSNYMAEPLKIGERPWVRIEGIFDENILSKMAVKEKNKTILYTGSLARRYGIINLIEAFTNIEAENYRLWICGEGDTRKDIEKNADSDKRIIYFGQLIHEEVLLLQKRATVLINPRTSEGVYTKYSFPSKTIEYLASGTPTILHRLEGIPDEYLQYCYVAEEENAEGLKKTILSVCEKDQKELNAFGHRASRFIVENKNPIYQVKKIHNMLS